MLTLGERIRQLRQEKDLSLRELAKSVGVSAAFLSDVELGRRYPSDKHLAALAKALPTSVEDLRQYDTRPPISDLRRMTISNPEFGFAFRQLIENKVKPEELIRFVEERSKKQKLNKDKE
jgi:transcriptional regulator with XRE-family HTH domain